MNASLFPNQTRRHFVQSGVALAASGLVLGMTGRAAEKALAEGSKRASPNEALMEEHGLLNRVLIIYEESIRRLTAGEEMPPDPLRDAAKIVRKYIEEYHEMLEQDFLFPRFINGNVMKDLVQVLLEQHLGGRNLTDEVLHLATSGAVKSKEDRDKLSGILRKFVFMYHAHEAREDTVLFPAFRGLVSAHEYDALREDFAKRERDLFGGESFPMMLERVVTIEKQLGIYELARYTQGF
jgi:hemerythrin-like domain-containing protein